MILLESTFTHTYTIDILDRYMNIFEARIGIRAIGK